MKGDLSKLHAKNAVAVAAAISLLSLALVALFLSTADSSKFDSTKFKNNPDQTRLRMYEDLKSKRLKDRSKEEILNLLGEPLLGITESNKWIYPMGEERGFETDLVITFSEGKVRKYAKVRAAKIDD